MALFIDVHSIEGSGVDVAEARQADLARQLTHGEDYLRDCGEEPAKTCCLVDTPDTGGANTVHPEAHGLGADEVYSVSELS